MTGRTHLLVDLVATTNTRERERERKRERQKERDREGGRRVSNGEILDTFLYGLY